MASYEAAQNIEDVVDERTGEMEQVSRPLVPATTKAMVRSVVYCIGKDKSRPALMTAYEAPQGFVASDGHRAAIRNVPDNWRSTACNAFKAMKVPLTSVEEYPSGGKAMMSTLEEAYSRSNWKVDINKAELLARLKELEKSAKQDRQAALGELEVEIMKLGAERTALEEKVKEGKAEMERAATTPTPQGTGAYWNAVVKTTRRALKDAVRRLKDAKTRLQKAKAPPGVYIHVRSTEDKSRAVFLLSLAKAVTTDDVLRFGVAGWLRMAPQGHSTIAESILRKRPLCINLVYLRDALKHTDGAIVEMSGDASMDPLCIQSMGPSGIFGSVRHIIMPMRD